MKPAFPFSALVGHDDLKLALLLVAIDPLIGGVLITGERGTAKSTAARGIAALLPPLVTGGAAPFVELPLGATEDRVVGSLDISTMLQEGRSQLRSGLLARANHGVLYVDEVNLLPDHLVDLLLDAAASGWVNVERDGVSAGEAAQFMLVGTMNPEEGALRPQFLDRFGLCVRVRGLHDHAQRVAAVRQRMRFDDGPVAVIEATRAAENLLRERLVAARQRLPALSVSEENLALIATLSIEQGLEGIRGDLAVAKTARALAAWEGASEIHPEQVQRAAVMALAHRARTPKGRAAPPAPRPSTAQGTGETASEGVATAATSAPTPPLQTAAPALGPERITLVTEAIEVTQGGRGGADARAGQRVVGVAPLQPTGTLAFNRSVLRAAGRGLRLGVGGVALATTDLLQQERRGDSARHVLFIIDGSGSMAVAQRLSLAKGVALGLLADRRARRDEIAMLVFRGESVELVVPFSRDTAALESALAAVPTGGRTPLAAALREAAMLLETRSPSLYVLFTDGRANVSARGGEPWDEALAACGELRQLSAGGLVIDCERGPVTLGRARLLAQALKADLVGLDELDTASLTLRIEQRLETL